MNKRTLAKYFAISLLITFVLGIETVDKILAFLFLPPVLWYLIAFVLVLGVLFLALINFNEKLRSKVEE